MDLITQELWHQLPSLHTQRALSNPLIFCHFYLPDTQWDWYVLEFDGTDIFYGWLSHVSQEFATFYLSELRIIRGLHGMPVLRSIHFTPRPLAHVQHQCSSLSPIAHPDAPFLSPTLFSR